MQVTFRYKHNLVVIVGVLVIFVALPLISAVYEMYTSLRYVLVFLIIEAVLVIYPLSKWIVAVDEGVRVVNLFFFTRDVFWKDVEEAFVLSGKTALSEVYSRPQSWMEPLAGLRWIVRRRFGGSVKLIVSNDEALYLPFKKLHNGSELCRILETKVKLRPRVVSAPSQAPGMPG